MSPDIRERSLFLPHTREHMLQHAKQRSIERCVRAIVDVIRHKGKEADHRSWFLAISQFFSHRNHLHSLLMTLSNFIKIRLAVLKWWGDTILAIHYIDEHTLLNADGGNNGQSLRNISIFAENSKKNNRKCFLFNHSNFVIRCLYHTMSYKE